MVMVIVAVEDIGMEKEKGIENLEVIEVVIVMAGEVIDMVVITIIHVMIIAVVMIIINIIIGHHITLIIIISDN